MAKPDAFFEKWESTYPADTQREFHRDGIIDEPLHRGQLQRVVFALLEPNSKGGNYDRFRGADLRDVFKIPLGKSINKNLALWTRYLLDGVTADDPLSKNEAREQLRRVALINLKKIAGSGRADYVSIGQHAWRDRRFLREQIQLMEPTLIVTCGAPANRILGQVLNDDLGASPPKDRKWSWRGIEVLPANHPSLRGSPKVAFQRLIDRHGGSTTLADPGNSPEVTKKRREPESAGASTKMATSVRDRSGRSGWILRPYPHNNYRLGEFLESRVIAIGWPHIGDLGRYNRDSLLARVREVYADEPGNPYGRWVGTLLRFRDEVRNGDLVVVAPKLTDAKTVAIAEIVGPYRYDPDLDGKWPGYPHLKPVRWTQTTLARKALPTRIAASLTRGTLHRTDGHVLAEFCRDQRWI